MYTCSNCCSLKKLQFYINVYLFQLLLLLEKLLLRKLILNELISKGGWFVLPNTCLVNNPLLRPLPPLSEQFSAFKAKPDIQRFLYIYKKCICLQTVTVTAIDWCIYILKGTVSVVLNNSPFKGDKARFPTVPFKALSDQV